MWEFCYAALRKIPIVRPLGFIEKPQLRKFAEYLILYLGIFALSVYCFFAFRGSLTTVFFGFPSYWALWFFFLYAALPLSVFIRLIYRLARKKSTFKQSRVSFFFVVGVYVSHFLYDVIVTTYPYTQWTIFEYFS